MANPEAGFEIELKFQVPADRAPALRRALATARAQTLELRALYFDTADERLAKARLAWRLRREGGHWVQTLKGAGDGMLQRSEHELRRDPADGDPPLPDAALHAGHPAHETLLRALRADGGVAAEVAICHGTEITRLRRVVRHAGARIEIALDVGAVVAGDARAPVTEIEFELLDGPVASLLDLAARWARRFGLRPDPATKSERAQWLRQGLAVRPAVRGSNPRPPADCALGQARAALVAATLAHALPNAAALTEGRHGPDHLHQLRVALRRLRSVLRAIGPAEPLRDAALATLFAALGGARDADVLAQTLAPLRADAQAAGIELPALAPAGSDAADLPDPGTALRRPGTTRLWLMLIALAQPGLEDEPWAPRVRERLQRWRRRARRGARDWARLDESDRHRLRRQLKRLRYLFEFAAATLPAKPLKRELAALRRLQAALGRWNDLVVARQAIAALPASEARSFGLGWLAAQARHADADCARAARDWRALDRRWLVGAKPPPGGALNPRRKRR